MKKQSLKRKYTVSPLKQRYFKGKEEVFYSLEMGPASFDKYLVFPRLYFIEVIERSSFCLGKWLPAFLLLKEACKISSHCFEILLDGIMQY